MQETTLLLLKLLQPPDNGCFNRSQFQCVDVLNVSRPAPPCNILPPPEFTGDGRPQTVISRWEIGPQLQQDVLSLHRDLSHQARNQTLLATACLCGLPHRGPRQKARQELFATWGQTLNQSDQVQLRQQTQCPKQAIQQICDRRDGPTVPEKVNRQSL